MLDWLRGLLLDFDDRSVRKIELASEEAFINIIRHSYKNHAGKIEVEVTVYPKSHVEIAFRDHGPPFNPLQGEKPLDRNAPLEKRKEGGLGIHLMRQYMDDIHYERVQNTNQLVLVKKLSC